MFKMWWQLTMLAAEAQQVIWLRSLKFAAAGPGVAAEAQLMGSEKLALATQAVVGAAQGDSPIRTVKRYRKKVRANRRRLSK